MMRVLWALPVLALLAACQQADDAAGPSEDTAASEAVVTAAPASEAAAATRAPASGLDEGALTDRENPARLLAFLSTAISAKRWDDAARVWHQGEMDGARLKAELGGHDAPLLSFGQGEQDAGAGSLFYQAPIIVVAEGASPRQGTIMMRRVNDVDGAEEWQLNWHVERIEWQG